MMMIMIKNSIKVPTRRETKYCSRMHFPAIGCHRNIGLNIYNLNYIFVSLSDPKPIVETYTDETGTNQKLHAYQYVI